MNRTVYFNSPHPLFRRLGRSADAALEAEGMKVVSESVATLTPDERRAAAEWARARSLGGRGHCYSLTES